MTVTKKRIQFDRSQSPYNAGDVAVFPVQRAEDLVRSGFAHYTENQNVELGKGGRASLTTTVPRRQGEVSGLNRDDHSSMTVRKDGGPDQAATQFNPAGLKSDKKAVQEAENLTDAEREERLRLEKEAGLDDALKTSGGTDASGEDEDKKTGKKRERIR